MSKKKRERELKDQIALLSIEKNQLHREVIKLREKEKRTKEMKARMVVIFNLTKEIDHSLADLYCTLRSLQVKIYGV